MKRREFLKNLGAMTVAAGLVKCAPKVAVAPKGTDVTVGRPGAVVDNLGIEFGTGQLHVDGVYIGETTLTYADVHEEDFEWVVVPRSVTMDFRVIARDGRDDMWIRRGDMLYVDESGIVSMAGEFFLGMAREEIEPGETAVIPIAVNCDLGWGTVRL